MQTNAHSLSYSITESIKQTTGETQQFDNQIIQFINKLQPNLT